MSEYIESRTVQCKDCYRCLRECPIKAIEVRDHHARIREEHCILCGHCTQVCPQHAKVAVSELEKVRGLLKSGERVVASVAPSFVASLSQPDFVALRLALARLGFAESEETAVGAREVVAEYANILSEGGMRNLIASACPAACRLIQMYYPKALPYLAPVASPMVVHARMLKSVGKGKLATENCNAEVGNHAGSVEAKGNEVKVVFIGPCLAKIREARESGVVDAVLTFGELQSLFAEQGIDLSQMGHINISRMEGSPNKAKAFPVPRGIIQSFEKLPEGYTYMAVDGLDRCRHVLEYIEELDHVFVELNVCANACVGGPCAIGDNKGGLMAQKAVIDYVEQELSVAKGEVVIKGDSEKIGSRISKELLSEAHPRLRAGGRPVTDEETEQVLRRMGKTRPEDELNCGACGYSSCREKAWAVVNGYADIEMCLPYMRKRAESLAVDIVRNSPDGVILVDADMNIVDTNATAMQMLGMKGSPDTFQGRPVIDFFPPIDFYNSYNQKRRIENKCLHIAATGRYVSLSVSLLTEQGLLFGLMKDISDEVNYNKKLEQVRMETISTTDALITKQMRVAQEIASLLGETTAETKVALLNLKKTLKDGK